MKPAGDIPADHLELARELETLENWFATEGSRISSLAAAKGFTCISHDYYSIFFDEEGDRTLIKADKEHPGYFREPIFEDMARDEDFNRLVKNLKTTPGIEIMRSLGFGT